MRFVVALIWSLLLSGAAFAQSTPLPGFPPGVFDNAAALAGGAAPPSVTQLGTNTGYSLGTLTATVGATVPAGTVVFAFVFDLYNSSASSSVKDSAGNCSNAYSLLGPAGVDAGANGYTYIFYCLITTGLTSASTITYTSSAGGTGHDNGLGLSTAYASGLAASSPNDSATTATAGAFSTSASVTSGTPGVSGELFICLMGTNNGAGTFSLPSGWTALSDVGGGNVNPFWIVNAGSSPKTCASTSTSNWWAAMIGSFKP